MQMRGNPYCLSSLLKLCMDRRAAKAARDDRAFNLHALPLAPHTKTPQYVLYESSTKTLSP